MIPSANNEICLRDVLNLISKEEFPLIYEDDEINFLPNTSFKICLSFMAEESTWITCNIEHAILIPWYDCKVTAINPMGDDVIQVWLDYSNYLKDRYSYYLEDKDNDKSNK